MCHVDVDTKDNDGFTPLSIASLEGHLDIVKYLCETCHANIESKNIFGYTVIQIASIHDQQEVAKYLHEHSNDDSY